VVFTTVQNLVRINAAVLIICMVFDVTSFSGKRLFTPPKLVFWGGFDPINGEAYQRNPQKAHPWAERRHITYRSSKSVHRCDPCACRMDQKRERKKPNSGKLDIRRDHPRCRIEMKSCVVGRLQIAVVSFEYHQNRLSGFGAVEEGVEICICPSPLTWPLAYTTACTTMQAVMILTKTCRFLFVFVGYVC